MTIENPQPPGSSQSRRPWRAVARTTATAAIALLPILPKIADAADIDHIPIVVIILAIAAAITRVIAIPEVDDWLDTYLPWLAADPYQGRHRGPKQKEHP